MSKNKTIDKTDAATLIKAGRQYDVIPRDIAQSITDPDAAAYYLHLLTLPDNWIIRRTYLMKHFGIGRVRHERAIKTLKGMGLLQDMRVRNKEGKFTGRTWVLHTDPNPTQVSGTDDHRTLQKCEVPESARLPETDHIQSQTSFKETDIDNKETNTCANRAFMDDLFERYWEAVPVKRSKIAAKPLFAKAIKDSGQTPQDFTETLITHLVRWRAVTEGQYIPQPRRYLAEKLWLEDIPQPTLPPRKPTPAERTKLAREAQRQREILAARTNDLASGVIEGELVDIEPDYTGCKTRDVPFSHAATDRSWVR